MTETIEFNPVPLIANELNTPATDVNAVVKLLSEGNTVPFIARYRKEMTGSMDEVQIRLIEERNAYLQDLEKRRRAVLDSIEEQGKLTNALRGKILACTTKSALEDLYLPYKPKRRTRATIAKEKGLEPLALRILEQPLNRDATSEAQAFVDAEKGVEDVDAALAGARDIVAEIISENADVRTLIREKFASDGLLISQVVKNKKDAGAKFKDYFDFDENVARIPSHRFLAVRRGEREGFLKTGIQVNTEPLVERIKNRMNMQDQSSFANHLAQAVEDGYRRLLAPSVESDVRIDLKMRADKEAVEVFAGNLRALLLAPPLGSKPIIGIDPGLRTGCKCAAVDATGEFLGNMTFNIIHSERAAESGKKELTSFIQKHAPSAIAVGNGTGGREAEKFVKQTIKDAGITGVILISVSEAGASVYSASELAGKEFPNLDLTVRGAISIARRLQDPLAELVKIEPKAIGVGQYQHDVHQPLLSKKLEEVVESCVNGVGVELNTASSPLLSHVAGIGPKTADNIIELRSELGGFKNRKQLHKVKGLGPKAFEQAAGFLRIHGGGNPLDASAVHPERYNLVSKIAEDIGVDLKLLVGNNELVRAIDITKYVSAEVGKPTLRDIADELRKPGRDPRDKFEPPAFRDDVNTIANLEVGMQLEGVVTNVTNFGAFVDVGIHRDGLVHISQLSDNFVKDPKDVVKVGDKLKVRVLEIDMDRERISFTAKSGNPEQRPRPSNDTPKDRGKSGDRRHKQSSNKQRFSYNPFTNLPKK
ncbi:MAG: RNA-binding transcriptional accessory protein [Deltaproteobacteria bacterium]|nr:RNA-binding transcriptional accessory protein [Deltaproteobacteria bacterium]